jgi:hypothetical protein
MPAVLMISFYRDLIIFHCVIRRFVGGFGARDYRQQQHRNPPNQTKFGGAPAFNPSVPPPQVFYGGGYGGSYGGAYHNQPAQASTDWWGN